MKRAFWPLVALCAVLGLTLRLWNIDFDQRQHLHPDERFWAITSDAMSRTPPAAEHGTLIGPALDWLDGQRSPSNPYRSQESFLYGPISLSIARTTAGWLQAGVVDGDQPAAAIAHAVDWLGVPLIDDAGAARFDNAYGVDLVGRMLGAVFDTITLVVIALIGRRLAGNSAGVAAAGLYAFSVLMIQLSHFFGAEPLLGLGCALVVLATLRLDRSPSLRGAVVSGGAAGLATGLAMSAKLNALGLALVPLLGSLGLLVIHRRRSDLARLGAFIVGSILSFRVLQPSAFNGLGMSLSRSFLDDLQRASELSTSTAPPSFQWANRTILLQPLIWLGKFTIGPGATICAIFGGAVMISVLFRGQLARRLGRARPSAGVMRLRRALDRLASSTADGGRWPIAVVGAAAVLPFAYIVITALPTGRYFVPMLPGLYVVAGVGATAGLRLALRSVGRVRAVVGAATVAGLGLAAVWGIAFVNGVYAAPNTRIEASEWIAANIPAASVLSSEAWDDGLPLRLPGLDADAFESEQLNLVGPDDEAKVAQVADQLQRIDYVVESSGRISDTVVRMPARFPSTIKFFEGLDSGVLGFARVATFTRGLQLGPWRLDDSSADEAFSVYDHPQVRVWAKVRSVPRDEIVDLLDPIAASNAVAVDPNTAGANGLQLYDDDVATNAKGPTYDDAFDTDGSNVLHAVGWLLVLELLGLAAFALFFPVLRRLPDAGLGVSKVMALVLVSTAMFVAGAWLHVALSRSLVVVLCIVLITAGAISARRHRAALADLWRDRRSMLLAIEVVGVVMFTVFVMLRGLDPDLWHPDRGGEKPFELALLTAVLRTRTLPVYDPWYSGGALNYYYGGWLMLSVPARLLKTSPLLVMNLAMGVVASCASTAAFSLGAAAVDASTAHGRLLRRRPGRTAIAGFLAAFFVLLLPNGAIIRAAWRHYTLTGPAATVDWWGLSRVIPRSVAITEFPGWSLLFGDVHPHVLAVAMLVGLATLCIAWNRAIVEQQRRHACVLALLVGITGGMIRATNTWDSPLTVGLMLITAGSPLLRGAGTVRSRWRLCIGSLALAAAAMTIVWAPYSSRGEVFDAGFDPATQRTPLSSWLEHFGFFAAITALVAIDWIVRMWRHDAPVWRKVSDFHLALFGVASVTAGYIALRPGRSVLVACAVLATACGSIAVHRWRSSTKSPLGPLALTIGWAVQAGVELVNVRNDGGRANTVFKFWFESWLLLAVGVAVVVAEEITSRTSRRRRAAAAFVSVGALGAFGFWWLATPIRVDDRISAGGLSLAGEGYLREELLVGADDDRFVPADDVPLIDWIRANVEGVRVVAEAPGIDYRWTGRISWSTGLPAPIGWSYHETQQRRPYGATIGTRQTDMDALYTTTDPHEIARVLSKYSVAYLVFGTQERLLASDASADALRGFECLSMMTTSDPSPATGGLEDPPSARDEFYVAEVDQACVIRLRPTLPRSPPPAS